MVAVLDAHLQYPLVVSFINDFRRTLIVLLAYVSAGKYTAGNLVMPLVVSFINDFRHMLIVLLAYVSAGKYIAGNLVIPHNYLFSLVCLHLFKLAKALEEPIEPQEPAPPPFTPIQKPITLIVN
jgi:hypothetical protein